MPNYARNDGCNGGGETRGLEVHLRPQAKCVGLAVDRDERGSPTIETVLIAAGLAALAITAVAIIALKVTNKANNIPTGP